MRENRIEPQTTRVLAVALPCKVIQLRNEDVGGKLGVPEDE
jgi:hypothetical protein